jgi:hypothetical protein
MINITANLTHPEIMHIFSLLETIEDRPGFYLDGGNSLRGLMSFLNGYQSGAASGGDQLEGMREMHEFQKWLVMELSFESTTGGTCNMILARADSDEKAYELFFRLLRKYRQTMTIT